jgi:16S rRNA (guanine966-N2)-methyltransferase
VFVDAERAAAAAIRDNLARTRLAGEVVAWDVLRALRSDRLGDQPFDLVLVDPPYAIEIEALQTCLEAVADRWLPESGWTVVLTRGHKGPLPAVPLHWAVARQLRYGDSLMTQYREVGWA